MSDTPAPPALKRVMGTKLLLLFIVGDILGTGIYALVGEVAAEVGGAAWLPFLLAFAVALVTALSYLELVTRYPNAGGAGVYVHKAYGRAALTFGVSFAVVASGVTSASTAASAFAGNFARAFGLDVGREAVLAVALAFVALVMAVNLRGVAESVKANVVLTLVELSGLLLVIGVGVFALTRGRADLSQAVVFASPGEKSAFLAVTAATSLAFFAMVGFEDSVNMAEETKDPVRIFPRVMLTGLTVAAVVYVLVSLTAVALVPVGELAGDPTPLVTVVERGAPGLPVQDLLPFISMFAVANSALINMLMASRLVYGMARQRVLPGVFATVLPRRRTPAASIVFTTALAAALIVLTTYGPGNVTRNLGGTTSLLLLAVFAVVNGAVLAVRRRGPAAAGQFRAPTYLPHVGVATCVFLVSPLSGRDTDHYLIAGALLAVGAALWALNRVVLGRAAVAGGGSSG